MFYYFIILEDRLMVSRIAASKTARCILVFALRSPPVPSGRFYIAQEIDQPFGEDSNDLPVICLQQEFNQNLLHMSGCLVAFGEGFLGPRLL